MSQSQLATYDEIQKTLYHEQNTIKSSYSSLANLGEVAMTMDIETKPYINPNPTKNSQFVRHVDFLTS